MKHVKSGKWITRLKTCYYILSGKYKHWVILNLTRKDLISLIKEEEYEMDIMYSGLQPYNYHQMVKGLANTRDEIDEILDKATYEANAQTYKINKKK